MKSRKADDIFSKYVSYFINKEFNFGVVRINERKVNQAIVVTPKYSG